MIVVQHFLEVNENEVNVNVIPNVDLQKAMTCMTHRWQLLRLHLIHRTELDFVYVGDQQTEKRHYVTIIASNAS